tara:strand:+ start:10049 stop:10489 length:441 start_codon:yes stop_codon:yes gene_type:complete
MQVILLESLNKLGKAGEVVAVKDGYAKNYLIPQNKAIVANKTNLADLKNKISKINTDNDIRIAEAKSIKENLDGKTYEVQIEANDEGVLYGSINQQQIIRLISNETNNINTDSIVVPQIKNIGEYSVTIRLYEEISATIILSVIKK